MKKITIKIKWMVGGILILSIMAYWMFPSLKSILVPVASSPLSQKNTGQSSSITNMSEQITSSSQQSKTNNPAAGLNPSQEQNNITTNNQSNNTNSAANSINPIRTNTEILQAIEQLNENRDKINSVLTANAMITAQIRQQAQAGKFQTVTSQSIPGPNTDPAPADLLEKLKSNQLMHH